MICNHCGAKFFANGNKPTPCPNCLAIHLPVVVSAGFIAWCHENKQDPHVFAHFLIEKGWERHKEESEYSEARLKEGSR